MSAVPDKKGPPEILIVDDDADLVEAIATALEQCGFVPRRSYDGRQALDEIARSRPAMILLDMKLPRMNGWEFSRELYDRYGRTIPIIVMTAKEDSELRANEIGADSYVGKPFQLSELCRAVYAMAPLEAEK